MLSSLFTRRNSFIAICLVIAFSVAMFAPLRREYTSTLDSKSGEARQQTVTQYGAPFIWLTLSKEEGVGSNVKVYSSSQQKDMSRFAYDSLIWIVILAVGGMVSRITDSSSLIIAEARQQRRRP
jgi:hypothetical protein